MTVAFIECPSIPEYLSDALRRVRRQFNDLRLFTHGGCGILAASLATLCQQHKQPCNLQLIHRYDPRTDTDTLTHITLSLPDTGACLDISGAEAGVRWLDKLIDDELDTFGESLYEFSFEDIAIYPDSPAPVKHLQRITTDYELRLPIMPYYGDVLGAVMAKNNAI